ncbi:MAG: biopolymer transporter ExbD [Planctomycetota bacterium]|nr:biopolymer transporter ExbD [Planctomycetota bacterium]
MADAKSTSESGKGQPTFIARRKKARAGTPMTNPPLTPLIDVFLFLIIFFLLGCKFAQYEGTIPANLPKTGSGLGESSEIALPPIRIMLQPADEKGDTITIATDGAIGKRSVSDMQELCTILAEWGQKHGVVGKDVPKGRKQPIFIHPVLKVRWGFVVDAFNQAVRAGYTEVGVAPSRNAPPT